jgi:hypothetical protein
LNFRSLRDICAKKIAPLNKELASAKEPRNTREELDGLAVGRPANSDATALSRQLAAFGIVVTSEWLAVMMNLLTVVGVEVVGGICFVIGSRPANAFELHRPANADASNVIGAKLRASVAFLRFTEDSICDSIGLWPIHHPISMG